MCLSLRCNPFFEIHNPREFNIPQKKNANELGLAWYISGNHRSRVQKKIAFSYSDQGSTLDN